MSIISLVILLTFLWMATKFVIAASPIIAMLYKIISSYKKTSKSRQPNNKTNPQKMVSCYKCRLYIPIEEAIYHQGKPFCCEQHRCKN